MKKHTFRKILVTLLVLAMVVPCLPVIATAEDAAVEYTYVDGATLATDDDVTAWFNSKKDNVLEIGSVKDLACFMKKGTVASAERFNGVTIKLTKDIVWNDGEIIDGQFVPSATQGNVIYTWTPFWTNATNGSSYWFGFRGTFDGAGHTISGIYMASEGNNQGFFAQTGTGAVIKDVTFENTYSSGAWYVSAVVVRPKWDLTIENVDVVNCYLKGGNNVGAFVAYPDVASADGIKTITIDGCTASGTISSAGVSVGGFIGTNRLNTVAISDSISYMNMPASKYQAGFVGVGTGDMTFDNCVFAGTFSAAASEWAQQRQGAFTHLLRNNDSNAADGYMAEADGTAEIKFIDCFVEEGSAMCAVTVNSLTPWYNITVEYCGLVSCEYTCADKSLDTAATLKAAQDDINAMFMTVPAQTQDKFEILGVQMGKPNTDGTVDIRLVAGLTLGNTALDDIKGIGFDFPGMNNPEFKPTSRSSSFIYETINNDYGKSKLNAKDLDVDYLAVLVIEGVDIEDTDWLVFRTYCDIGEGNAYSDYYKMVFTDGAFNKDQSDWLEIAG